MRILIREFQKNTEEKFEIFKRFPSASGNPLDPTFYPLGPSMRRIKRASCSPANANFTCSRSIDRLINLYRRKRGGRGKERLSATWLPRGAVVSQWNRISRVISGFSRRENRSSNRIAASATERERKKQTRGKYSINYKYNIYIYEIYQNNN